MCFDLSQITLALPRLAGPIQQRRVRQTGDLPVGLRSFPFWIVSQRRGLVSRPVEVDGMPGIIAAFKTAEEAAAFMANRGEKTWENKLVSRSTFNELKDGLLRLGLRGFYFDPRSGKMAIALVSTSSSRCDRSLFRMKLPGKRHQRRRCLFGRRNIGRPDRHGRANFPDCTGPTLTCSWLKKLDK